ncbi:hypothetical protein KKC1_05590 [Calderihabitans maritimus]|uniref:Uncharacterized protein n=1 Tax=Calderihabitans maritimus TaxID=1246530 RepID=A0A1Z5HPV5_9FIRM|nr:hypothetical protein KKC1_05590 [Calderihabitans maritimus]
MSVLRRNFTAMGNAHSRFIFVNRRLAQAINYTEEECNHEVSRYHESK